jgi:hypothetical protein
MLESNVIKVFYKWFSNLLQVLASCLNNFKYCINDLNESIKLAIHNDDIRGLDYIIKTKVYNDETALILKSNSYDFLPLCYSYHNKLSFAEKLIKAGAIFDSTYVAYTMPIPEIKKLKDHIKIIKSNITKLDLFKANKIIESMDSALVTIKTNESCIDYLQTLLSITYTDDKNLYPNFNEMHKGFINDSKAIVTKLSRLVCHANYPEPEMKILAPIFRDHNSAFHSFTKDIIYTPFFHFDALEKSILVHEKGHYIMYTIFGNNGYPFAEHNIKQIQEYDLAATKTLCGIGKLIDFQCNNKTTKGLKSHEIAFGLLQKSIITLFYYRSLLNDEETNLEITNKLLKIISVKFNINPTLINKHGHEKAVDLEVEKLVTKYNLTQDLTSLLERVGEYVNRGNADDYSSELIVRIPELITRSLDSHALNYLEPLHTLWLDILNNVNVDTGETSQININNAENITDVEIAGNSTKEEL